MKAKGTLLLKAHDGCVRSGEATIELPKGMRVIGGCDTCYLELNCQIKPTVAKGEYISLTIANEFIKVGCGFWKAWKVRKK